MRTMKGLILAGGLGKRLRPLTHSGPKQLIPIANKPVMHYAIEELVNAGVKEIGIVVGYTEERINAIHEACGSGEQWGINITYIEQDGPKGLAHAVWTSKDFLGNDSFVMFLGDNIIGSGIKQFVDEFGESEAEASLLLARANNPERFGVAEIHENKIISVEEKPDNPKSDTVMAGVYIFKSSIMAEIEKLEPSARGELEITHAIQNLLSNGKEVIHHTIDDWWDDAGTGEDVIHANEMILSKLEERIDGTVEDGAEINGVLELGHGSVVNPGAKITGPVKIGKNSIISGQIKPYTSIGDNVKILSGHIGNSIIMNNAVIDIGDKKIENSLIGKNSKITRADNGMKFMMGEDSSVEV
jgi:glucose-1-phosphate thymidylyltransferase